MTASTRSSQPRPGRQHAPDRPLSWIWTACLFFGLVVGGRGADPGSSALPDAFPPESLLWEIRLGTHQYTVPRIEGDRIFIGINDTKLSHPALRSTGGGILMCLDRATGDLVWQQVIPRNMGGTKAPFHFNHWKCGVCSRPALDGKRLYVVGPRGEVLCLDRQGQADGNDPPFLEERAYLGLSEGSDDPLLPTDGDILWKYDLIKELSVVPHDVCGSTPIVHGDYVYACTSNGVDDRHDKVANPEAPSLIVLDKHSGQLAATDAEYMGRRLFHGTWSSPVAATFRGQERILFGGGDGILYAFEPFQPAQGGDGSPTLKKVWQHDCVPAEYRERDGQPVAYSRWNNKSEEGPSEIIATPVVDGNRIYVAIGQSPIHGPGRGMLSCVDGTTGRTLWENRQIDRTLSDVAVHDGLLYIPDYTGRLHCLEAHTGKSLWQHDLESGVWCASPVVVDGNVYISTEKRMLWVFKAGRTKEILSRSRLPSEAITLAVAQDVLYLPTQQRLFAIRLKNRP